MNADENVIPEHAADGVQDGIASPAGSDSETVASTVPKSKLTGRARSLANLKPPFKKGEVQRPHGTSKKDWSAHVWLRQLMGAKTKKLLKSFAPKQLEAEYAHLTTAESFWARQILLGMQGKGNAARLVAEYLYGPPEQTINLNAVAQQPIVLIRHVVPDGTASKPALPAPPEAVNP